MIGPAKGEVEGGGDETPTGSDVIYGDSESSHHDLYQKGKKFDGGLRSRLGHLHDDLDLRGVQAHAENGSGPTSVVEVL
jgi:hypothetical protein